MEEEITVEATMLLLECKFMLEYVSVKLIDEYHQNSRENAGKESKWDSSQAPGRNRLKEALHYFHSNKAGQLEKDCSLW